MGDQSGNHMHAAPLELRQYFEPIPIQENPRHHWKRPAKQRQCERVPAVQLDEEMPLLARSRLAEGADDPAQPGGVLRRRDRGRLCLACTTALIGPASETTMLRAIAASICATSVELD